MPRPGRPRQPPCWLSIDEAALYLHCRREEIAQPIAAGTLKSFIRPGKSRGVIVHADDLDDFVRTNWNPGMCEAAQRIAHAMEVTA